MAVDRQCREMRAVAKHGCLPYTLASVSTFRWSGWRAGLMRLAVPNRSGAGMASSAGSVRYSGIRMDLPQAYRDRAAACHIGEAVIEEVAGVVGAEGSRCGESRGAGGGAVGVDPAAWVVAFVGSSGRKQAD